MGKLKDLTGKKYGRLTVVGRAGSKRYPSGAVRATWLCQCECGNTTIATTDALNKGTTLSCGCYLGELREAFGQKGHLVHGGHGTRLYRTWKNMKQRCTNPRNQDYRNYGGRGISVCEEWSTNFDAFRVWAMDAGYKDELSLDRIDPDGNYCPENCRWTTNLVQGRNKRTTHHILFGGTEYTCIGFAEFLGVSHATISRWQKAGATPEQMHERARKKQS